MLAGAAVAALVAFVLGFLLAKYRGIFFGLLSLALSMILYGLLVKNQALGSTDGFNILPSTLFGIRPAADWVRYCVVVAAAFASLTAALLVHRYLNTPLGRLAPAIKDNEIRVEYMGASAHHAIHVKYVIAAILAGVGGALAATNVGHIDPEMADILHAQGLNKSFGAVTAASNVDVLVEKDSIVGLIGANGAGKTTFINLITGYLRPDTGAILFEERDITRLPPREITRLGICRSFQMPQLYSSLSVYENMMVGLGVVLRNSGRGGYFSRGRPQVPGYDAPAEEVADRILDRFGLADDRDKNAQVLPGGVRKLLDIALTMVAKPRILLLDEPTSGVSAQEKFGIMEMVLKVVRAEGATVLFVEHDMEVVSRFAQRVLAFYDGRIIADAAPQAALADPEVKRYVVGNRA